MKKRRKHKQCLNCGQNLHESHNYCSNCGQENTDNEASLSLLLREFTSNFFSLDSRFVRTFKPFLFRPGEITRSFNEGKRVFYANPIRWYLVISLFHFFFFTKLVNLNNTGEPDPVFDSGYESEALDSATYDSLMYLPDSLVDKEDWPLPDHYFRLVDHLSNEDFTSEKIIDTLKINDLDYSWFRRQVAKKVIKLNVDSQASVNQYLVRQIPIIMFFILPLYAFLLKLFFWKKGLYIQHLIHSLHIHSFVFLMLGLVWIMSLIFPEASYEALNNIFGSTILGIIVIYIFISFRRVYQTRWINNIFRLFGIGFLYLILLGAGMLTGVVVSLLFY